MNGLKNSGTSTKKSLDKSGAFMCKPLVARLTGTAVCLAFVGMLVALAVMSLQKSLSYGFSEDAHQGFKTEKEVSFGAMPHSYQALFILAGIFGFFVIALFGAGLKGAKGINSGNPYVKGQPYVRSRLQTTVFRVATLMVAAIFLGSFLISSIFDNLDDPKHNGVQADGSTFFQRGHDYILGGFGAGYFQCFVSSFVIAMLIIFKKYKGIKFVGPMAVIGAVRTFFDIQDGVGTDAAGDNIDFHRAVTEHLLLIVAPLFIIVAQRDRYKLRDLKPTLSGTFALVFVPYLMDSTATGTSGQKVDSHQPISPANKLVIDPGHHGGEIRGVVEGGKLGGATEDLQKAGLTEHYHLFYGCMYVPFGIALIVFVVFNVNFGTYKSEAEGNFGKRGCSVGKEGGQDIKNNQGPDFKNSFTNFTEIYRVKKDVLAPFGVDPKVGEAKKRK